MQTIMNLIFRPMSHLRHSLLFTGLATLFIGHSLSGAEIVFPNIVLQPVSQTNPVGSTVSFSVQATGAGLVTYEWRKNGSKIARQTNASLTLTNITPLSAGNYSAAVSILGATTLSSNAVLTVTPGGPLPYFTLQPASVRTVRNGTANLAAKASSTSPVTYQWRRDGLALASGADKAAYNITKVQPTNTGIYTVVASNWGGSVTSQPALVTIVGELKGPAITITNSPKGGRVTNAVFALGGRASDLSGVTQVLYSVSGQAYKAAIGTTNWTSGEIGLTPGANVFYAKAVDMWGNVSALASKTIFYSYYSPLTVQSNGSGSIYPNLNGNIYEAAKKLTLTAKPAAGFAFAGWTGGITNSNPTLNFLMQSNLTLTANFVTNPYVLLKGTYNGLLYTGYPETSGSFSFAVKESGAFSGSFLRGGSKYSYSGKFDIKGNARVTISSQKLPCTIYWQINLTNENQTVLAKVYDNPFYYFYATGNRMVSDAITAPSPYAGSYTMAFTAATNAEACLSGDGYGTATVTRGGSVSFGGVLADGTTVTTGSGVSKIGQWPLYVPLNGGKGMVIGWVSCATNSSYAIWGQPSKPGAKFYPQGFTNAVTMACSRYQIPTNGQSPALNLTNGWFVWSGGNLAQPITNAFSWSSNNIITVDGTNANFTLTSTNGILKGAFWHPMLKKSVPCNGVLLQDQVEARGFFLGTNQSGAFQLIAE